MILLTGKDQVEYIGLRFVQNCFRQILVNSISRISSAGLTTQQPKAPLGAHYVLAELSGSKSLNFTTTTLSHYLKEVQDKSTLERHTEDTLAKIPPILLVGLPYTEDDQLLT